MSDGSNGNNKSFLPYSFPWATEQSGSSASYPGSDPWSGTPARLNNAGRMFTPDQYASPMEVNGAVYEGQEAALRIMRESVNRDFEEGALVGTASGGTSTKGICHFTWNENRNQWTCYGGSGVSSGEVLYTNGKATFTLATNGSVTWLPTVESLLSGYQVPRIFTDTTPATTALEFVLTNGNGGVPCKLETINRDSSTHTNLGTAGVNSGVAGMIGHDPFNSGGNTDMFMITANAADSVAIYKTSPTAPAAPTVALAAATVTGAGICRFKFVAGPTICFFALYQGAVSANMRYWTATSNTWTQRSYPTGITSWASDVRCIGAGYNERTGFYYAAFAKNSGGRGFRIYQTTTPATPSTWGLTYDSATAGIKPAWEQNYAASVGLGNYVPANFAVYGEFFILALSSTGDGRTVLVWLPISWALSEQWSFTDLNKMTAWVNGVTAYSETGPGPAHPHIAVGSRGVACINPIVPQIGTPGAATANACYCSPRGGWRRA